MSILPFHPHEHGLVLVDPEYLLLRSSWSENLARLAYWTDALGTDLLWLGTADMDVMVERTYKT
jgi:hypothetical protein